VETSATRPWQETSTELATLKSAGEADVVKLRLRVFL
jgi:hypothetical protein